MLVEIIDPIILHDTSQRGLHVILVQHIAQARGVRQVLTHQLVDQAPLAQLSHLAGALRNMMFIVLAIKNIGVNPRATPFI